MSHHRFVSVEITRDRNGYTAVAPEIPNSVTAAHDLNGLLERLAETISWSLEYDDETAAGEVDSSSTVALPESAQEQRLNYQIRLVGLTLDVERDMRSDRSDSLTEQGPRTREQHRDGWPERRRRPEGGAH